ncbi:PIN2/TERF1-interacting telomerase inhibitor 1 [Acomys russatus]|uniref:PIN2/TERF1-interacting telomerase inhibitor 1 n=1 Tax=Acomys russatus TaxID=60746 RepID=UPI0021E25225|nr:PIN2/TERF1-interacting telomerase inhibitor 1 [Acomys russatus]
MSMLAERRRKQKWTVDPRNTAWSNDDSKFGQRMLEKMGWSKGKGLGAQEQGATEHIKVKVKNNHLGLGATNNNEDNWIAHQDDFNQLLAALNTCHSQETAESPDNKEKKSFSLEEKSRISKNRVHYMKFTKGKDLSSRSETDLDCIFGKRKKKKLAQDSCSNSTADEEDSSTTITTTSAFTIQEYFAKRMAQVKNKSQASTPGPDLSEAAVEWEKEKKKTKEAPGMDVENSPQSKAKQHKKKRRVEADRGPAAKKRDRAELQPAGLSEDECSDVSVKAAQDFVQTPDSQDDAPKPKKRKAKKKLQRLEQIAVDTTLDKAPEKKKKKASR